MKYWNVLPQKICPFNNIWIENLNLNVEFNYLAPHKYREKVFTKKSISLE